MLRRHTRETLRHTREKPENHGEGRYSELGRVHSKLYLG